MINAFQEKIRIMKSGVKMAAICADLGQINLQTLNSTISSFYKEDVNAKKEFDIIYLSFDKSCKVLATIWKQLQFSYCLGHETEILSDTKVTKSTKTQ